jgi:hypothetical protein
MTDSECVELKNIKYKSMLLTGSVNEVKETVENMSNLDMFLEGEKHAITNEPWTKLDKTTKLHKFKIFVSSYCNEHTDKDTDQTTLYKILSINLDRKKLLKAKDVVYDKESGLITSIPSLFYNTTSKKFSLKRCDKRPSTLKSLAPKKLKGKKIEKSDNSDKIDINN